MSDDSHIDLGNPAPAEALTLQQVRPARASTAGGTELHILGTGFAGGSTVAIDGVQVADVRVTSPRELVLKAPARLGSFGPVPVVVQSPDGQRVVRNDVFAYVPATVSFTQGVEYSVQKRPLFVAVGDA